MRRVGRLYPRICDRRNFSIAAHRAALGKRSRGEVVNFLQSVDGRLNQIIRQLGDGTFSFGEYRSFTIRDPKQRMIHAPTFRDRVVHHAMIRVVGPIFELGAMEHSFACRKGRGPAQALEYAFRCTADFDWFLKMDVAKFYDSISHEFLRQQLARRFRERRVLDLFDRLLDSYNTSPGRGLPIGALTSQYLGNFCLDSVDRWIKQEMRIHRYVRYMDDMLLWGTREQLRDVLHGIPEVLDRQGLRLDYRTQLNRCSLGVPFVGFTIYPDRIRVNRRGRKRVRRKMRNLEAEIRGWQASRDRSAAAGEFRLQSCPAGGRQKLAKGDLSPGEVCAPGVNGWVKSLNSASVRRPVGTT